MNMADTGHANTNATTVFCGTLVHSTASKPLDVLGNFAIGFEHRNGKILFIIPESDLDEELRTRCLSADCVTYLTDFQFLMPGLVDTHIHAPQYVYAGTALDLPLLDWLNKYTFPVEAQYKDIKFASEAYRRVVKRTLASGTTTALYFATLHKEASLKLAEIAVELGQRAFVGKVNMDQNSPDYYVETTEQSLKDTEWFVKQVQALQNPLVQPVVTPRFAPSCSSTLMKGLADIAKKHQLHVQSHISENIDEVEWVKELFPQCENYTDVYDTHGLMTDKTVLAHCIYLDDGEIDVFKNHGTAMSHCPCSNFSLRSGVMDSRKMIDHGVKVGLGTDVSGGYSPSMLNAIQNCVTASNTISIMEQLNQRKNYQHLQFAEAFKLATLGGCEALGISDTVGNFEVGKEFDALLVNLKPPNSPLDVFQTEQYSDSKEDMIQKFIFLGDDRNIQEVYVKGRRVKPFSDDAVNGTAKKV
ncbi:guanine deaminase-like [Diadema setosum]|uniref:guanine deaminase-like n=1 Tax=Diadema setosum TaxID=31175 RepID=UPI003B3A1796